MCLRADLQFSDVEVADLQVHASLIIGLKHTHVCIQTCAHAHPVMMNLKTVVSVEWLPALLAGGSW